MRRSAAYAIVVVAAVTLLLVVAGLLVPVFAQQVGEFFAALPGYVDQLMAKRGTSALDTHTDIAGQVSRAVTTHHLADLAVGLLGGVATVAGALFFGFTTVMISLLLLWRLPRIKTGALRLVVASRRDRTRRLADAMLDKVGSYLVGAVLVGFAAGLTAFLWCWLTGVPYPFLMAVVVALFDMIPQIGATIGSTVVILVAWTTSFGLALATLVFFCAYQGIENWIIYPRVMSQAVKISNLAAIVAALVGGALFGVLGVLLAVPAFASLQLLVREVVIPRQDAH
jgi:predicted PurR-regulated permease PerM